MVGRSNGSGPSFLNVNIQSFDGRNEYLQFFFDQISEFQNLNKITDEQTLFYLKSKLTGPALQFCIQSQDCKNAKNLTEIRRLFENFFSCDDSQSSLSDLENLKQLPDERIKCLAHRLDLLFCKAYPSILDVTAINQMKFNYLMKAIDPEIKLTILKENIDSYSVAIDRAQNLQNIFSAHNLPTSDSISKASESHSINVLTEKINDLKNSLEKLKEVEKPNINRPSNKTFRGRNFQRQSNFNNRNRDRNFIKPYNLRGQSSVRNRYENQRFGNVGNRNNRNAIKCFFCLKTGHLMRDCYQLNLKFRSSQNKPYRNQFNRNQNSSRINNDASQSGSSLNPNAAEYLNLNPHGM